jgi:BASS family bile acid:Na+ symporter
MGKTTELHLPILSSIVQIFFVTLLPAFLGVFVRKWKPGFAHRLEKRMKYILLVLLGAVYSIKFFAHEHAGGTGLVLSEIINILPYTLIFNVICFVFGIYFGRLTRLAVRDAFTVAIEVSLHNTTLAILIAGTMLQNQEMVKPALIYSMFSFWTAIIFGMITRRIYKDRLSSAEEPG